MSCLRSYYRRIRSILFIDRHQPKTVCLYFLNILLAFILAKQFTSNRSEKIIPKSLSLMENYQRDISDSMESFDFMHRQKMASKPIPPPEDHEPMPIIEKRCDSWWNRKKSLNASVKWNQDLWQSVQPASTEIYLYSAFFDDRPNSIFPQVLLSE